MIHTFNRTLCSHWKEWAAILDTNMNNARYRNSRYSLHPFVSFPKIEKIYVDRKYIFFFFLKEKTIYKVYMRKDMKGDSKQK